MSNYSLYNNLPHNNEDIATLNGCEAINLVNDMIDNMRLTLDLNVYNPGCYFSKKGIAVDNKDIRLYEIYLYYLWAVRSFEYSLDDIKDFERLIDHFEQKAYSPTVQSDIEDNLQIVQELSQNLSLMIDKLVLEEACFLIKKREYFYACVQKISVTEEETKERWGCNLSNSNREWFERQKLPLLYQIELLEDQMQRSLT